MNPTFFKQSFFKTLSQLIANNQKSDVYPHLFVAFSGGLDSNVLLHLTALYARQRELKITAVHINHGLSENAGAWQQHCQRVCEKLGLEFVSKSVVVEQGGQGYQGLEGQARKARYDALAQVITDCAKSPYRLLLTGQHQQDQVETYLLRLKRGSGAKGLAAMASSTAFYANAFNDTYLLRPLLDVSRSALEDYAKEQDLSWIDDESNTDTRFDRNFLRHEVIPVLNGRWPQFDEMVCRSAKHLSEQQQLIDEISEQDLLSVIDENGSLCVDGLLNLSVLRRNNVLRFWFEAHHVSMPSMVLMQRISDEVLAARVDAQPKVSWQQTVLRRFKGRIYLTSQQLDCEGMEYIYAENQSFANSNIELMDAHGESLGQLSVNAVDVASEALLRMPKVDEQVSIRFAKKGQFNQISCRRAGHKITQKLGDLFKAYQVVPWQRNRTPLIYYNQQLVAAAGLFICDSAAITDGIGLEVKVVFNN